jgi:hypothetical protein
MSRGWQWIDEEAEHDYDTLKPMLDRLAQQWSELTTKIERDSWRRQADAEDGDDPSDHFETEEELKQWQAQRRADDELERMRLGNIESLLAQHGARMMRPYEHWNEDERYMQYMESDRFGNSC